MGLNAATIEILIAKGLNAEDLLEVARATESTADTTGAERQRRYRERKKAAGGQLDQWESLRAAVFERDNFTCVYCGYSGDDVVCDHSTPVLQGGKTEIENLVTACKPCNSSKAGRTPEEWLQ